MRGDMNARNPLFLAIPQVGEGTEICSRVHEFTYVSCNESLCPMPAAAAQPAHTSIFLRRPTREGSKASNSSGISRCPGDLWVAT